MKKLLLKIFCALNVLAILASTIYVSADSEYYTINGKEKISMPQTYSYEDSIDRIIGIPEGEKDYLLQPADMYIDSSGCIFLADTGNDRIVKLDKNGNYLICIKQADGVSFDAPEGVFVDSNGNIFIADTGNGRIIMTDSSGRFVKNFAKPESTLLSDISVYSPSKISVSSKGIIYILLGEKIMSVNMKNEFLGYIGQTDIEYSFTDAFLRTFASDEQKKHIEKRNAIEYVNITVNSQDLIYSVSRDTTEGQIKVLNSVGTNIYKKLSDISTENKLLDDIINGFFSGNLISKSNTYGERVDNKSATFVDICVDDYGIITAIEKQNGRLYQYDQEGNLLTSFGGLGKRMGYFSMPSSIAISPDGSILVLDSSTANIQIFKPTAFIGHIQKAITAYYNGDYSLSEKEWRNVTKYDDNYPLCKFCISNIEKKNKNYVSAMDGYRFTNDREKYSEAFALKRYDIVRSNFVLVILGIALISIFIFVGITFCHRKSTVLLTDYELLKIEKIGAKKGFVLAFGMLVHPLRTLDNIRGSRKRISLHIPVLIIASVFLVRIIFIYSVSYHMQDIELNEVNLALEFIKLIVPILTWAVATFLISGQFGGESTLKENFVAVSYCFVPYIVANTAAILMSHLLSWDEKGWYTLMVNGVMIWIVVLIFEYVRRVNDYTVSRSLLVCLLSLICMVLCWFAVLFGYLVVVGFLQFISEILQEFRLMTV